MLLGARQRGVDRILRASEFLRFSAGPQGVDGGIPDHAVAPPHACMHTYQSSPAGGCLHGPCGPIDGMMPSSCMHAHYSSHLTHPDGDARMVPVLPPYACMRTTHLISLTCRGMPGWMVPACSPLMHSRGLRDAVHTQSHTELRHSPGMEGCRPHSITRRAPSLTGD